MSSAVRRFGGSGVVAPSAARGTILRWLRALATFTPGAARGAIFCRLGIAALVLGLLNGTLYAQTAPTSLTIYNDGRVLVRRLLPLDLPRGESDQKLVLGALDPGSVFPLDPGVDFVRGSYDAGVDQGSVLRHAVGRRLTFRIGKETVSADLVGVDPERYRLADGTISFERPGSIQFPAELVPLEPTLNLRVSTAAARKDLRVGYFTEGGGWAASYQVILGGKDGMARVLGQAVVNGGTLRLEGVELQLLAGEVNVAARQPQTRAREEAMLVSKMADATMPSEQRVGEFHLYSLPGQTSLDPGRISTVALFEQTSAKVTRSYEVVGQVPYWGGLPQYGEENEAPVTVTYTVLRPRKTDLGDRPLPGGVVRLFEPDSAGRLQLIGEAATDHAPAGEDLRLAAGTAFDLTAKRIQTSYSTRRDSLPGNGWRTSATADYRVSLTNAGDSPVTVEVVERRGGEWSVLSSSVKPEKVSSTRTVFRVPLPARGKATLTYRVRVIW